MRYVIALLTATACTSPAATDAPLQTAPGLVSVEIWLRAFDPGGTEHSACERAIELRYTGRTYSVPPTRCVEGDARGTAVWELQWPAGDREIWWQHTDTSAASWSLYTVPVPADADRYVWSTTVTLRR